jgi:hypothetical protein
MIAATLIATGVAFGSGLWLGYGKPSVTLVPGTPVGVSIGGGPELHNPTYIATLVRDLNGYPPIPAGTGSSCLSDPSSTEIHFSYRDGDRVTVAVIAGCGPIKAYASYASDLGAVVNSGVVDDLSRPPAA